MVLKPLQRPHVRSDGVGHPNAIRRAASRRMAGWGGRFEHRRIRPLRAAAARRLAAAGAMRRASDLERISSRWTNVRKSPAQNCIVGHRGVSQSGRDRCVRLHGTPAQVRERLEEVVAMGANHLLLTRYRATPNRWKRWPKWWD